jgi:hypothetical protein
MIRVIALYTEAPDPERYEQHVEICRTAPGATFRHGKVLRTLSGEPQLHYYAEFEFADMAAMQAAGAELAAAGKDAAEMGVAHSVQLVELS